MITWNYIISIRKEYLKPFNCVHLFVIEVLDIILVQKTF